MTQQQAVAAKATPSKLPMKSKLAYGLGDFASQLTWSLVSSYLALFYTDVALIPAAAAAAILLVARVVDAVIDPVIGYVAERTNTRWGRFRPYIMFGAPFLAIVVIATFISPDWGQGGKIAYATITYILMGILYSVVNMLYGALAGVMTKDYKERLSLNWFRGVGGGLGGVVLQVVTYPLIAYFSINAAKPDGNGYFWTAAILAVVSIPMFWLVAAGCKEVINPEPNAVKVPMKETARAVLGNGPLMAVAASLLLLLTGLFGRLGVVVYYILNNMQSPQLIAGIMTTFGIATTVGQIVFPRFAFRFGKKQVVIFSMVLSAVVLIGLFFCPPENVTMVFVLTALYGMTGFGGPIILSMIPDAVDYGELKTGIRSDGTAYAAVSFATKVASAVGAAIGLAIMGAFGYVATAAQNPSVLFGINVAANLVPAFLALTGAAILLTYKLDEKTVHSIREQLDARQADKAEEETQMVAPQESFVEVDPKDELS